MEDPENRFTAGPARQGEHCFIGLDVHFGENVTLGHNCVIEDGVCLGANTHIESNTVIRAGVQIGANSLVGSGCILGEYGTDFCQEGTRHVQPLTIGDSALIRSGSILYAGSEIGFSFQTGHQVTIREKTSIGDHVSVGTLSDLQGNCVLGNYVRLHSNVHIGQLSRIDDFVWIYPYVVLTNDPTPPSEQFAGVHVHPFAIIATGAIVMPGLDLGQDCLIGAGAIVTRSVDPYAVVVGNPAKTVSDVRKMRHKITGEKVYPWREHFDRYMPWENTGFHTWYTGLTQEEKEKHGIEALTE